MENLSLLVSDLDGTLLGDESSLNRFAKWFEANRDEWKLVYSSGRLYASVREVVETTSLPDPDAVIAGVGTDIRHFAGGKLPCDWPAGIAHWDLPIIRNRLAEFSPLELQPNEFQSPFKLSYYAEDLSAEQLDRIEQTLRSAGQQVNLVYSSARDLDVLPMGVNKGTAAARLAALWNLEPWQVFVAGDTGNDASMFAQGFRGIVVGNAKEELKRIQAPTIYQARRAFAAGVQEGLEFWIARSQMA